MGMMPTKNDPSFVPLFRVIIIIIIIIITSIA